KQFLVDARLAVEALGVAGRHQLDQVVPALFRLGQQDQVVVVLADGPAAIESTPRRDINLAAENRVQPALARVIVKRDRREHVAVLGDGNPRHAIALDLIEQLVDAAGAVEEGKLSVEVKMYELGQSIPTRSSTAALTRCRRPPGSRRALRSRYAKRYGRAGR